MRTAQRSGVSIDLRRDSSASGASPTSLLGEVQPAGTRVMRDAWWVPMTSAIVPGAGQLLLRQDRALAYMALEAFIAAVYVRDRHEAQRQRASYRELARTVARALFDINGLPDGEFEYYERMQKYVESGVYDLVPGGTVEPEVDEVTFNGSVWRLARETFWSDPKVAPDITSSAYLRALAFYNRRAVRPEFRWSWRNAQLEQDLYVRTIDASNQAFRRTIADLGALLANHALSTVDAYVTLRLRWRGANQAPGDSRTPFIEATLPWPSFSHR